MIKQQYFPGLDAVRALAIAMVLWWHYIVCITRGIDYPIFFQNILNYSGITWSGVDLFFVLSGFLITNLLLSMKKELKFNKYFFTFYIRRIFRILPPYYFLLIFFFIIKNLNIHTLVDNSNSHFPIWTYVFFIQNFWMTNNGFGPYFLGATWSLSIEEQFYLILPIIIFYFPTRNIVYVFLIGIIFAPIVRLYYSNTELGSFVLLASRMDSLFFGSLIAFFFQNNFYKTPIRLVRKFSLLGLILIIPLFILIKLKYGLQIGNPILHSLLSIIYALIILYTIISKTDIENTSIYRLIIQPLAKLSYMIYLIHEVVLSLFHQLFLNQKPEIYNMQTILITVVSLIFTIVFAKYFYIYIESPLIKFSKKF